SPVCYFLVALLLALAVRLVLGLLKCYELATTIPEVRYGTALGRMFIGLSATDKPPADGGEGTGDYLAPLVLGYLELLTYPVLMRGGYWLYVGAWVSLKTLAQYTHWVKNRSMFNRFLIGTAL